MSLFQLDLVLFPVSEDGAPDPNLLFIYKPPSTRRRTMRELALDALGMNGVEHKARISVSNRVELIEKFYRQVWPQRETNERANEACIAAASAFGRIRVARQLGRPYIQIVRMYNPALDEAIDLLDSATSEHTIGANVQRNEAVAAAVEAEAPVLAAGRRRVQFASSCPICLCDFETVQPVAFECDAGHLGCEGCAAKWLRGCPVCRGT